jgi:hypothetical protein
VIALIALGLLIAFAAGAIAEAHRHRCPPSNATLLARLDTERRRTFAWRRAAVTWRDRCQEQQDFLAALGRSVVADVGRDTRRPS